MFIHNTARNFAQTFQQQQSTKIQNKTQFSRNAKNRVNASRVPAKKSQNKKSDRLFSCHVYKASLIYPTLKKYLILIAIVLHMYVLYSLINMYFVTQSIDM